MDRRRFLGATGAFLLSTSAGCLDTVPLRAPGTKRMQPPEAECSAIERPAPPAPVADGAIQPVEYPGPPACPLEEAAALEFATAFERAYRRNLEVQSADPHLIEYGMTVRDRTIADGATRPEGSALVHLQYVFHGSVAEGPIYDSSPQFVSYYVDPTLVVRAATSEPGVPTEIDWPDPWTSGTAVACFEREECDVPG